METITVNDEIKNKISVLSRYLEDSKLPILLTTNASHGKITEQFLMIGIAIFQGCFTVPRVLIGKNWDYHSDDDDFMNSDLYPLFINYLQSKSLNVKLPSGQTVDVGAVINGAIASLNPIIGVGMLLGSILSSSAPVPEIQEDLFKKLQKVTGLFYDFLEEFKKYNPTFDITPYLPDPSKYVLNDDVKTKNVEYFQTSSFNNLVGMEIQNLTTQKAKEESDRKAKLPQPYTAEEIAVFCLGLVILGLTAIGIKKASQN